MGEGRNSTPIRYCQTGTCVAAANASVGKLWRRISKYITEYYIYLFSYQAKAENRHSNAAHEPQQPLFSSHGREPRIWLGIVASNPTALFNPARSRKYKKIYILHKLISLLGMWHFENDGCQRSIRTLQARAWCVWILPGRVFPRSRARMYTARDTNVRRKHRAASFWPALSFLFITSCCCASTLALGRSRHRKKWLHCRAKKPFDLLHPKVRRVWLPALAR